MHFQCAREMFKSNCLNSKIQRIFLMMTLHHLLFTPAATHLQRSHLWGIKKLTCFTSRNEMPNEILKEKISKSIFFSKNIPATNSSKMSKKSALWSKSLSTENIYISTLFHDWQEEPILIHLIIYSLTFTFHRNSKSSSPYKFKIMTTLTFWI